MELKNLFNKKIDYDKIENKIKIDKIAVRLAIFLLAMLLSAIVFNLFLEPLNITVGGTSGLSIIFKEVFNINVTTTTYFIYIITLILSTFLLPRKVTLSLIIATIVYPFFVGLTSNITDVIILNYSNPLLICIFAGILNGVTTGLVLKIGFNSGGLIVVAQIIYRYFKISISKTYMLINVTIMAIGGYYFGVINVMYAIIVMYISTIVTDKVMLGISSNKVFFVTTNKEKEITDFILKHINSGVTIVDTHQDEKTTLMCAVPTSKYFVFKEGIVSIDKNAFWYATDSYQVHGEFKGGKYGHNKNEKRKKAI